MLIYRLTTECSFCPDTSFGDKEVYFPTLEKVKAYAQTSMDVDSRMSGKGLPLPKVKWRALVRNGDRTDYRAHRFNGFYFYIKTIVVED